MKQKLKVLVVDDAQWSLKLIGQALSETGIVEIVGLAKDAFEAREILLEKEVDLMILDIVMPKLDGLTFLGQVMKVQPVKTIVLSAISDKNSRYYFKALELGAIEVLKKPVDKEVLVGLIEEISEMRNTDSKATKESELDSHEASIIGIVASTGGPRALQTVLQEVHSLNSIVVVVQHMPSTYMSVFAQQLQGFCRFPVQLAKHGQTLQQGKVYVAPGDHHLQVKQSGTKILSVLNDNDPVHGIRPSADFLFNSMAALNDCPRMGVVLTGMGTDGCQGALKLYQSGARILTQSQETCVVYGMPKAVESKGASNAQMSPKEIGKYINGKTSEIRKAN